MHYRSYSSCLAGSLLVHKLAIPPNIIAKFLNVYPQTNFNSAGAAAGLKYMLSYSPSQSVSADNGDLVLLGNRLFV